MILYLDTSAVVKLYASEEGSAKVRREVSAADQIAASLICYVETRAALRRKFGLKQINASRYESSKGDFDLDWTGFLKMPVDLLAVVRAADLAEQFGLRAYDAIHLASAERLGRETGSRILFVCFDAALNRAAVNIGLKLVAGNN